MLDPLLARDRTRADSRNSLAGAGPARWADCYARRRGHILTATGLNFLRLVELHTARDGATFLVIHP